LGIRELGPDSPGVREHVANAARLRAILTSVERAPSVEFVAGLLEHGRAIADAAPYPSWTAEHERRLREELETQRAALLAQRRAEADDWIWSYLQTVGPIFEVPLDAGRAMTLSTWRDRPHLPGQRGCQPPAWAHQNAGSNGSAYCAECPAFWH